MCTDQCRFPADANIRTHLADAELQHPQKQKKDEQILDVLGLLMPLAGTGKRER